nr:unnamed protein product [Callosobruchus analis]
MITSTIAPTTRRRSMCPTPLSTPEECGLYNLTGKVMDVCARDFLLPGKVRRRSVIFKKTRFGAVERSV